MSIRHAFGKAGIVRPGAIRWGGIYAMRDDLIVFPEDRLPGARKTPHEYRSILVLQCQTDCDDPNLRTVLIAPLSTKKRIRERFDHELAAGTGNLRSDTLVKLAMVQPVLKVDLEPFRMVGDLPMETMRDIITVLLANVGGILRPVT